MTVLGDILTNRTALEDKIVQLKEKARKENAEVEERTRVVADPEGTFCLLRGSFI